MAKWKAPKYRRRGQPKKNTTGGKPKGYLSSDVIDWTDEMKHTVNFCRRQLGLPLRVTAAVVGVSFEALYRKMKFWRKSTRLVKYAPRAVRDDYIKRFKVRNYGQTYRPGQEGEE